MRIEPAKYGAFIPINPNATPAIAGPTILDMVVVERVTPIKPMPLARFPLVVISAIYAKALEIFPAMKPAMAHAANKAKSVSAVPSQIYARAALAIDPNKLVCVRYGRLNAPRRAQQ